MRFLAIGALALSVGMGACEDSGTSTGAAASTATPVAAPAAAGVGTTDFTREFTIPAGTHLTVSLDTPVGSDTSRVEEAVTAHLTQPLTLQGETVLDAGSHVSGIVTGATPSAKVKGRAHVALRFETLTPRGMDERYPIQTTAVGRTAAATKHKDSLEIGGGAAGGALIGALLGGKKGALIGTAAGGGAGTAVVLSTRGKEVHLAEGTALTLRLSQPVTIRIAS